MIAVNKKYLPEIRPSTIEDLKAINQLIDLYGKTEGGYQTVLYPDQKLFEKWIENETSWIAFDPYSLEPLGHIALDLESDKPEIAEIRTCVARNGNGKYLLEFAEEYFRKKFPGLPLFATVLNGMAGEKFFLKHGYHEYVPNNPHLDKLIASYYENRSLVDKKIYIKYF